MQNLLITAFTFIAVYKCAAIYSIRPLTCANIIAFLPFICTIIIRLSLGEDALHLVQWSDIITLILQFGVAFVVFYKLHHDDSAVTALIWGSLGLLAILYIPPTIFSLLFFI